MTESMQSLVLYLHLIQTLKDIRHQSGEDALWQMLELAVLELTKDEETEQTAAQSLRKAA